MEKPLKIERSKMRSPAIQFKWKERGRTAFWFSLALVLFWWFFSDQSSREVQLYQYKLPEKAKWITTQDSLQYTACLRKDFDLPFDVRHAHFSVAATGGFELLVNGNPVGAQVLWRPTRHYQNGLTDSGQRLSATEPIIQYNFPREYQWTGHNNEQAVIHFDLTPHLQRGHNVLCLELEGRTQQPSVAAFGGALLKNGVTIPLQTDASWAAEPVPKGLKQPEWMAPESTLKDWKKALILTHKTRRSFFSPVPPNLFSQFQETRWILGRKTQEQDEQVFQTSFSLRDFQASSPSYLKLLTYGNYWIWVNDTLLLGNRAKKKGYNGGEWMVGWEGRRPLATLPVLLDPDETGDFFGGYRYLEPSHGDPTDNAFHRFKNTLNRTKERPNATDSDLLDDRPQPGTPKSVITDPYGYYEEPHVAVPHTVLRSHASPQYHAFDLHSLLKEGQNTIRLRLVDEHSGRSDTYGGSQAPRFTLSGMAGNTPLNALKWSLKGQGRGALQGKSLTPQDTPKLEFKGGTTRPCSWLAVLLAPLFFCFFFLIGNALSPLRKGAIIFSLILVLAWILQLSLQERSEFIFTHTALWKGLSLGIALFLAVLQVLSPTLRLTRLNPEKGYLVLMALLLFTFGLRGWNAQYQPIDDDEYASIQAVLSIAKTGLPKIGNGDIWYSRSPGYHYIAALMVKLFGPNIWALRLYTAFLSALTGALLWHMARTYFNNTWTAHAALLLFALHPFLIFSGHVARFYQQQQFCILLMLHLFITGFLHQLTPLRRNGAILLFGLAVLSQEISISFAPVFILLYLLFGKGVPFRWELKSIFYIVFVALLIVADIALFQIKCITRSVGVSPNVEATLAPTFWELGNLFSMFIGYSRLHLVLSIFYLISLFYAIRRSSALLITLHFCLIVSIALSNFMITSVSFRYMYALIPIWILLGAHGLLLFGQWTDSLLDERNSRCNSASLMPWVALGVVLMSFSIWRIPGSYSVKLLGDPNSSLTYVRNELRAGDKVMITEPHPHAALLELGQVDYDLVVPILYDFTYNDLSSGGVLRDRNGNAIVVNRLAQLQSIFAQQDRVWILLNREKFRSRKKNLRWEYPGAREELFIRQNCELKFRGYLWHVYLWDQNHGSYSTFRKESGNWVE